VPNFFEKQFLFQFNATREIYSILAGELVSCTFVKVHTVVFSLLIYSIFPVYLPSLKDATNL
jgi:hypothetical protein